MRAWTIVTETEQTSCVAWRSSSEGSRKGMLSLPRDDTFHTPQLQPCICLERCVLEWILDGTEGYVRIDVAVCTASR